MIRVVLILALLIVAFSMTPATADAQAPYTFTLIADQVSCAFPCEGYLPGLAVNAGGTVAFKGCVGPSPARRCGIVAGRGRALTVIAGLKANLGRGQIEAGPFDWVSPPAINDLGIVAFYGCDQTRGCGLYLGRSGLTLLLVAEREPWSGVGSQLWSPGMSLSTVVFWGCRGQECGIFQLGSRGFTLVAANAAGLFSVNEAGTVAYSKCDDGGCHIFTNRNGATTLIADVLWRPGTFGPNVPAIDAADNVTFMSCRDARCEDGWSILLRRPGGPVTSLVETSRFGGSIFGPMIGSGQVAFYGCADGCGLFRGPDPLTDGILVDGDLLLGATVAGICCFGPPFIFVLENEDLNEKGQIGVWATLSDGRSVIVRADPVRRR